jgi:hypothetical protein
LLSIFAFIAFNELLSENPFIDVVLIEAAKLLLLFQVQSISEVRLHDDFSLD